MADMSEKARKAHGRFRFDLRFVIGLLLVAGSVAGVWFVVNVNDATTPVYRVSKTVTEGTPVAQAELAVTRVRLSGGAGSYVGEGELPQKESVIMRTLEKGELLPQSALVPADRVELSSVVVDLRGGLPESVTPGSTVDVWAAEPTEGQGFAPPAVIVDRAVVERVIDDDSVIAGSTPSVELLVPDTDIGSLLDAQANGHALSVVDGRGE